MRFSIITPCYNVEKYIRETMLSILQQHAIVEGRHQLQYIVVDGQSTDNTHQIIQEIREEFSAIADITVISEPDNNMYEALAKGIQLSDGNFCATLNAGDLYSPKAFDIVAQVVEKHPQIKWLTGLQVTYNDQSQMLGGVLPFRYRQALFTTGLYNVRRPSYVQTESTFWHSQLNQHLDFEKLIQFRSAGDYYMWMVFAQYADLHIVSGYLGGFRVHAGQVSENLNHYKAEIHQMRLQHPNLFQYLTAWFDRLMWYAPAKIKKRLNRHQLHLYDHDNQTW